MVDDMHLNDAVEEVLSNEAKVSVNRSQGALYEGPVLGIVVRHIQVGVVQVRDGN